MINDDVSNRAITICIRITKWSTKETLEVIKNLMNKAAVRGQPFAEYLNELKKTNSKKLKDLVQKGQLVDINIPEGEMKELKKQLNRYGVKFSVMKDKQNDGYTVFCQAKDTKVMDFAFKQAIQKFEKKNHKRISTRKNLDHFKEKVKAISAKDKVKNKHHSVER